MGILGTIQEKILGRTPTGPSEEQVLTALRAVKDPDLHKDIVTLGFVRNVSIKDGAVSLEVNLTTPACPVKDKMKAEVESILRELPGVKEVGVTMTATTRGMPVNTTHPVSQALGRVRNIIAVASGKGGVGKSTTSVNLAYALAANGAKVGLLDADVYGPSIPLMTRPSAPSGSATNMVNPPDAGGVKVISIGLFNPGSKATILRGPMAASVIKQFLSQVDWGELDYLVIDYPPGTGDIQLTISQTAPITGAVIVTTPQEVALIDVRKAISMFETLKVPVLGVVETMSWFTCDGCTKKHHIFREGGGARVAAEHGVAFLGGIPIEPALVSASDKGEPLTKTQPHHPASLAFKEVAGAVASQVSILHEQNKDVLTTFSIEWKSDQEFGQPAGGQA